jgi:hypothetical protein
LYYSQNNTTKKKQNQAVPVLNGKNGKDQSANVSFYSEKTAEAT